MHARIRENIAKASIPARKTGMLVRTRATTRMRRQPVRLDSRFSLRGLYGEKHTILYRTWSRRH